MDEIHEKALRELRPYLVKNINPDDEIQDQISDERVFTKQMIERIQAKETRSDRCREMLDTLPRRGPNAFGIFMEYLRNSEHGFVADKILEKEQECLGGTTMTCPDSVTNQSVCIGASQLVTDDTTTKQSANGNGTSDSDYVGESKPVAEVHPQREEKI